MTHDVTRANALEPDSSVHRYDDILAKDEARGLVVSFNPEAEIVVRNLVTQETIVLDDDQQVGQYLDSVRYQHAMSALYRARARRATAG
jgi:hypothetical protein